MALGSDQRGSGIEADEWVVQHQWVLLKPAWQSMFAHTNARHDKLLKPSLL